VVLLDHTVFHRDLLHRHRAETVNDQTLNLARRAAHVDDGTDILGNGHLVLSEVEVGIDRYLCDFGDMRRMAEIESKPLS